ncbi:MAG: OmpA family protein [Pseudomonadota bacterium]
MKKPDLLSILKCALVAVACMGGSQALASSNKIIGAADALFQPGGTAITPASQEKLLQLAERVDQQGQIEVMIILGHAEASEPDPVALSERRAAAARFHMIQLGVPPRMIYTEGKGATRPLEGQAAALQRRAEIEYVGLYDQTPGTSGFRLLDTWRRIASSAAPRDTQTRTHDAWDAMTPLQFLPLIKDAALRARFLQKYQLLAI